MTPGRRWSMRVLFIALGVASLVAPAAGQAPQQFIDLASDFAARIAAILPPGTAIRLEFPEDDSRTRAEVARLLTTRGLRIDGSRDATIVDASCGANLRERVCAAAVGRGDARRIVIASGALDAKAPREPAVTIELRPIYTQRGAMLDVAAAPGHLLVLTPQSVSLVADAATPAIGQQVVASRPITTSRVWPRDIRGMLQVSGTGFDAFLPGVTCRGTIAPLTMSCVDENEPWPIGVDNGGLAPSRNTFATPEGLVFYEAASIDRRRTLVVGEQGMLTWLDERRRATSRLHPSDHVAAFADSCGGDSTYVITSVRAPEQSSEALRLWRVGGEQLAPTPSTAALTGVLTSLWRVPAARHATAIIHDIAADRYEAFQISLSCAR
jgi:hypothetical protein